MAIPARFEVPVPGVGTFTFRRRTMRDQVTLEAAADKATGGEAQDARLATSSIALTTLETLTVEAPAGWNLDEMDPLDPDSWAKVLAVFGGLREAEERFRGRPVPRGEAARPGAVADGAVPVAPPLPAA